MEEKANARQVTASFLPRLAPLGPLVIPRVNALDTGLLEEDLAAVVGPHIHGVSVGKIYTPKDVETISSIIAGLEHKAGVPIGQVKLVLWIETAMAIVHCYEICTASPRLVGVASAGVILFPLGCDSCRLLIASRLISYSIPECADATLASKRARDKG